MSRKRNLDVALDDMIAESSNKRKRQDSRQQLHDRHVRQRVDDSKYIHVRRFNFENDPHLLQLRLQRKERARRLQLSDLNLTWYRTLQKSAPRAKYRRVPHNQRSTNHWGQRKLMLSEIEFLSKFYDRIECVVYAGAAPGTHINYLAQLFPKLYFVLVDPADFHCMSSDRIEIRQAFFTAEMAKELKEKHKKIAFISDIRTADPKVMDEEQVEAAVQSDMQMQMRWAMQLQPVASMHKFRLPWGDGQSEYLNGKIYLPVWGPQTTTETRLVVDDHRPENIIKYDNREYEEQMFHFNTVTRVQYYDHAIRAPGLDHCFDCASEIVILQRYLTAVKGFKRESGNFDRLVAGMCAQLSEQCSTSGGRTLCTQVSARERKSWFEGRQYDVENQRIVSKQAKPLNERLAQSAPVPQYQPRSIVVDEKKINDK